MKTYSFKAYGKTVVLQASPAEICLLAHKASSFFTDENFEFALYAVSNSNGADLLVFNQVKTSLFQKMENFELIRKMEKRYSEEKQLLFADWK
jgi:hypothetical protein